MWLVRQLTFMNSWIFKISFMITSIFSTCFMKALLKVCDWIGFCKITINYVKFFGFDFLEIVVNEFLTFLSLNSFNEPIISISNCCGCSFSMGWFHTAIAKILRSKSQIWKRNILELDCSCWKWVGLSCFTLLR